MKSWVIVVAALAAASVMAEDIRDHYTNSVNWNGVGVLDHFLDPDPNFAAAGAAPIVGNGKELKRVALVYVQGLIGPGGFSINGGDVTTLQWYFRFFPDEASFTLEAFLDPPPQSHWEAVFYEPINPGWQNPLNPNEFGFPLPPFEPRFNMYQAEFGVSRLHIQTVPGQTHLVCLVPEPGPGWAGTITALSNSNGSSAIGTESDWWVSGSGLGGYGPGPLSVVGFGDDYFAYKVTVGWGSDFDENDQVNLTDWSLLADCLLGPGLQLQEPCLDTDLDRDGDADMRDFAKFQTEFGRS